MYLFLWCHYAVPLAKSTRKIDDGMASSGMCAIDYTTITTFLDYTPSYVKLMDHWQLY